jgi:predicted ATPase
MFIQSLKLSDILSFHNPDPLPLRPLNIFIGANASGKSNLIDCIGLLRALPSSVSNYINDRGGAESWIWRGKRDTENPTIRAEVALGGKPLTYEIVFTAVERALAIQSEHLSAAESPYLARLGTNLNIWGSGAPETLRSDGPGVPPAESALSAYRNPLDRTPITNASRALGHIRIYRDFQTGTRDDARVGVSSSAPKHPLEEDGSNLALTLQELDFRGALQLVKHYLTRLSDRFEDIKVRAEGGRSQLYIQERGVDMISATRLSDGTLKFLCLMAVLCDSSPAPLICIEEPETGLHPEALALVGDALREAATRTQLIVTTHSDALVDRFTDEPETVVVCERDFDESTSFRRLSGAQLKDWLEDYTLGELWRRGEIGGTKR